VTGRNGDELRVAVLGLGEAGGRIAADLVELRVEVAGWDPDPARQVTGVRSAESASAAVRGAHLVLSVNSPGAAVAAATECASGLLHGALFVDLNSAGPQVKVEVGELVTGAGAVFVDAALMAPVPRSGLRTPTLASGPGAESFAERLRALGMPVEVVGPEPGQAAVRKLLRSVFMKGLASAMLESLRAARQAGCEDWLRAEIVSTLRDADETLVARLEDGSRRHAARRMQELEAACEMLRELGVEPHVAAASRALLAELDAWPRASTP
jgi:3-hydroxyisobutyrate dehydrogenase-like beta-hydroxyacid dehydrogenase